jgi:hypothetical protein
MPVSKYRSIDEVPAVDVCPPSELATRIRVQWRRALLLCPRAHERGVRRFRSLEAANEARMSATLERMRRRARVSGGSL